MDVSAFNNLMQLLPAACLLVQTDGRILACNDALASLANCTRAQLSHTRLHDLVADPPEKVDAYLDLCARSRSPMPGAWSWRNQAGDDPITRCDGAVLEPGNGENPAVIFIQCRARPEAVQRFVLLNEKIEQLKHEVLERKRAERARDELLAREREARLEAERISRAKDEFLATLSHELRTPLNAILGWSHLLSRRANQDADLAKGLEVIERNSRMQSHIIDDLLDTARIISGQLQLEPEAVDLHATLRAALASVRPAANAKHIEIHCNLINAFDPIKADPRRLQQMLWNLLSNAVKFTPPRGQVNVKVEVSESQVRIIVSDSGQGISPDFLPHLFGRFRQADSSTTRQHRGLGLGLSIVKQLAELHGGTIEADSKGVGQGATFTLCIPRVAVATEQKVEAVQKSPGGAPADLDLHGRRILVIDDELDTLELLKYMLEQAGAEVETAASARAALQYLDASLPDVVVADIGMPEMDGCAMIRHIRQLPSERGGAVPAIALTAYARAEERHRALTAGFHLHLAKPVNLTRLITAIVDLTDGRATAAGG